MVSGIYSKMVGSSLGVTVGRQTAWRPVCCRARMLTLWQPGRKYEEGKEPWS